MATLKTRALGGCAAAVMAVVMSGCTTAAETPQVATTVTEAPAAKTGQGKIEVKVLSSKYNMVSGGDALVEVKASEGARASDLRVTLNGRQLVTPLKFDQPSNTLRGLVTNLSRVTTKLERDPGDFLFGGTRQGVDVQ